MLYYKKTAKDNIFNLFIYVFMIAFCFTIIIPFWDVLMTSLSKSPSALGINFVPKGFTLKTYLTIFNSDVVLIAYWNTIRRTVLGVFLTVIFTFCGAYPLSKKHMPLRNTITVFFMITMFFSGGMIPTYLLVKNLHLIDNILALVLPGLTSAFTIFIVRNFIQSLPDSLEESAEIDGANSIQIMFRIVIPLSMPILATIALWCAVGHWNSWFDALIYMRKPNQEVLQMLLRRILQKAFQQGAFKAIAGTNADRPAPASIRAATIIVTIGPIVLVYPFLQKFFIKGIMIGSLKG